MIKSRNQCNRKIQMLSISLMKTKEKIQKRGLKTVLSLKTLLQINTRTKEIIITLDADN